MRARDLHIVITGANAGIGRTTAVALAREGAQLTLLGRSRERTQPVLDELEALGASPDFISMDLGNLASVREGADGVLQGARIDVLVNNAGLAGATGETSDGFELAFGVNHLGHFLLTHLLLPHMVHTGSRIVHVASRAHFRAPALDWGKLRGPSRSSTGIPEYATSKLCNVLFAAELRRRLPASANVWTGSLHPGVVATEIWREVPGPVAWIMKKFMISSEEGASTSLHCILDPGVMQDGGIYYDKSRAKTPSKQARDEELARELWERSLEWANVEDATHALPST